MKYAELLAAIDADLKLAEEATPDWFAVSAVVEVFAHDSHGGFPLFSPVEQFTTRAENWKNCKFIARYRSIGPGALKILREIAERHAPQPAEWTDPSRHGLRCSAFAQCCATWPCPDYRSVLALYEEGKK